MARVLNESLKKRDLEIFVKDIIEGSEPPKKIKRPGDAVKWFKDFSKDKTFINEQVSGFIGDKDFDGAINFLEYMKYFSNISEAEATKWVKKYGKGDDNYPLANEDSKAKKESVTQGARKPLKEDTAAAFEEGFGAKDIGAGNSYEKGTPEYEAWMDGYLARQSEDLMDGTLSQESDSEDGDYEDDDYENGYFTTEDSVRMAFPTMDEAAIKIVANWYDNEGASEDFDNAPDFADFIDEDILGMFQAATDPKEIKIVGNALMKLGLLDEDNEFRDPDEIEAVKNLAGIQ